MYYYYYILYYIYIELLSHPQLHCDSGYRPLFSLKALEGFGLRLFVLQLLRLRLLSLRPWLPLGGPPLFPVGHVLLLPHCRDVDQEHGILQRPYKKAREDTMRMYAIYVYIIRLHVLQYVL